MTEELSSNRRASLSLGFAALVAATAGVASISARDPDVWTLRYGMILMTVGVAFWMPLPALALAVPAVWLGPNLLRGQVGDGDMFTTAQLLELPGLLAIAIAMSFLRHQIGLMEEDTRVRNGVVGLQSEIDENTGAFHEHLLAESVERELVRSRRFGREFALMLADIDPMRAKFDYREDDMWPTALKATAAVLLNTRAHIDGVYRYGDHAFALLLPETGSKDITGLLRRLARAAKRASPPEGEPGGPLPLHFGVTFYPQCATTSDDLLRRAEVALKIAEKSPNRVQIDGAEAPDMPSPELLRQDEDELTIAGLAGAWLGAEAPDEEKAPNSQPEVVAPLLRPHLELVPAWTDGAATADMPDDGVAATSEASAVHEDAEAVAAQSWKDAGPDEGDVVAPGWSVQPAPVATAASNGSDRAVTALAPRLADDVAEMLKRMDETLAEFRRLKGGAR